MAYTQADLDALKKALIRPEEKVRFAGREVSFRSIEEIQSMIAIVSTEVDSAANKLPRRYKAFSDKGL